MHFDARTVYLGGERLRIDFRTGSVYSNGEVLEIQEISPWYANTLLLQMQQERTNGNDREFRVSRKGNEIRHADASYQRRRADSTRTQRQREFAARGNCGSGEGAALIGESI